MKFEKHGTVSYFLLSFLTQDCQQFAFLTKAECLFDLYFAPCMCLKGDGMGHGVTRAAEK